MRATKSRRQIRPSLLSLKRAVVIVVSVAVAAPLFAISAPAASAQETGLKGHTVTYGGGLTAPGNDVFKRTQGKKATAKNAGDTAYDPEAPFLTGQGSSTSGWVYESGPWLMATPLSENAGSVVGATSQFPTFADLASAAQCSAIAQPSSNLAAGGRGTVYAGFGWREWEQKTKYQYFTYSDLDHDGLFNSPDEMKTEEYYMSSYEYEWLRACGSYSGPVAVEYDCVQAIEYYLNGPYDQNGQPMRSIKNGGTNSRVPNRPAGDPEYGQIGTESEKLRAISDPLGTYMMSTSAPYKWSEERVLTEAIPAYPFISQCLNKGLVQKAAGALQTEELSNVGRYEQPGDQYVSRASAYEFRDYISNMALIEYLYPSVYGDRPAAGSMDKSGFTPYGSLGAGTAAVYITDVDHRVQAFKNYYSAFCYAGTGQIEVAEVADGNWRGGPFIYRDKDGKQEAANGRPSNEGSSLDFYSGACQKSNVSNSDVRGGKDILRCGDYNTQLRMAYTYTRVPYEYNTKSYIFETTPLQYSFTPPTVTSRPPTATPRPTYQSYEQIDTRTDRRVVGRESYIATWNIVYGTRDVYRTEGYRCVKGMSGMNVIWGTCYRQVFSHKETYDTGGRTPVYATRDIMGDVTVPVYGYVTRYSDCPSGTFLSGSMCIVADTIQPVTTVYSITTKEEPCEECAYGVRTVTEVTTSIAPPPAGYTLVGDRYVRVNNQTGSTPSCSSGYWTGSSCAAETSPGEGWTQMQGYWQKKGEAPAGFRDNGQEWVSEKEAPAPAGYKKNPVLGVYEKIDNLPAAQGWVDDGSGWTRVVDSNIVVQDPDGSWKTASPLDNGRFQGNAAARWVDDPNISNDNGVFQIWQVPATGEASWLRWSRPKVEVSSTGQDVYTLGADADLRWRVKFDIDPNSSPMLVDPNSGGRGTLLPNATEDSVYTVFRDESPDGYADVLAEDAKRWEPNNFISKSIKLNAWSPLLNRNTLDGLRALAVRWYAPTQPGAQGWKITPWWEASVTVNVTEDVPVIGSVSTEDGTFIPTAKMTEERTTQKRVTYQCPGQPLIANVTGTTSGALGAAKPSD